MNIVIIELNKITLVKAVRPTPCKKNCLFLLLFCFIIFNL